MSATKGKRFSDHYLTLASNVLRELLTKSNLRHHVRFGKFGEGEEDEELYKEVLFADTPDSMARSIMIRREVINKEDCPPCYYKTRLTFTVNYRVAGWNGQDSRWDFISKVDKVLETCGHEIHSGIETDVRSARFMIGLNETPGMQYEASRVKHPENVIAQVIYDVFKVLLRLDSTEPGEFTFLTKREGKKRARDDSDAPQGAAGGSLILADGGFRTESEAGSPPNDDGAGPAVDVQAVPFVGDPHSADMPIVHAVMVPAASRSVDTGVQVGAVMQDASTQWEDIPGDTYVDLTAEDA